MTTKSIRAAAVILSQVLMELREGEIIRYDFEWFPGSSASRHDRSYTILDNVGAAAWKAYGSRRVETVQMGINNDVIRFVLHHIPTPPVNNKQILDLWVEVERQWSSHRPSLFV